MRRRDVLASTAVVPVVAWFALAGPGAVGVAVADAPVRAAWWNGASVGPATAPSTTAAGDLHIADGPNGPLAYAALSYHVLPLTSATLTLHLVGNSVVGTPAVLACPTTTNSWKDGGDQPMAEAPPYSCTGKAISGVAGTDTTGATLTFLLDARSQLSPGVLTLAIVPVPGGRTPFALDIAKPTAGSLTVDPATSQGAVPPGRGASPPPQDIPPKALPGGNVAPIAGAPPVGQGFAPAPGLAAPGLVPGAVPPAGTAAAPVVPSPDVAGPAAVAPQAPALSAGTSVVPTLPPATDRSRITAAVLLAALVGGLGYLLGDKERPALRLLGGRGRAVPGDTTAPAGPVGGIGRFARARTAPARRLL